MITKKDLQKSNFPRAKTDLLTFPHFHHMCLFEDSVTHCFLALMVQNRNIIGRSKILQWDQPRRDDISNEKDDIGLVERKQQ
ncbi:hypothetical protein AVEN_117179-1 [Araneus ventricosus]|uniref:Uncharacterized protein n=1 Tax=Araneus ventricosus TaxID=182803 RepID=A0A4Y2AXE7_ARAVE|nr:hypothetical protein AVEN_117179-1 [Araneus ventricosus]